jgi:ubiquinone/menaquinone biosynthesis C-methylase UbiE
MDKHRRKYFDSFVDEWDKMFTAEDLELLEFLIDSFNIKKDSLVADLGCGTGVLFDLVRRRVGPEGMVIGVDFCSRMLKKARLNFPFENIHTVDGDVENLPLQSDYFDYAITFAAFAHFTNPARVMEETARILKKGGYFYIIHLLSSEELEDYHHQIGGPVAEDHLPSRDEMVGLFGGGSFVDIKITDHPGMYLAQGVKA